MIRSILRTTLAAALIVLAAGVPAPAQDTPEPRVVGVGNSSNGEAYGGPGAVLHVRGEYFPTEREGVAVRLGSHDVRVVMISIQQITVLVPPEVPAGSYPVVVTIGGRRVAGEVTIEILSQDEFQTRLGSQESSGEQSVGSTQHQQLLRLDARVGAERGMPRILVTGTVLRLPDGCVIDVELEFFRHSIQTIQAQVQGSRFEGVFGPFQRPLPAGPYRLIARFDVTHQHRRIQMVFAQAFPDADERRQHEHLSAEAVCYNPDQQTYEAQMQTQLQEAQLHYQQMVERARQLLSDLRDGYRSALKSAFRRPDGTFDEAAWRASTEQSYSTLPPAERTAKLQNLLYDTRFVDETQHFNPATWREWLDDSFRADVIALHQEHQRFIDRFACVRHFDAAGQLRQAIGLLVGISQSWSTDLYIRNQMPQAREDATPRGVDVLDIPPTVTPQYFQTLLDRVERDLEIGRYRSAPATDGQAPPR